jgi:hypothetical protein
VRSTPTLRINLNEHPIFFKDDTLHTAGIETFRHSNIFAF